MRIPALLVITFLLMARTSMAAAWRSDGTGYYPDVKPALTWAPDKNVLWKAKLPSWSNASPALEGDRIFVCSEPSSLFCISKEDGSIMWKADFDYASFLSSEEQRKADALAPKVKELEAEAKKLGEELKALRSVKDETERKSKEAPVRARLDETKRQMAEARTFSPPPSHNANGYSSPTPACDGKYVVVVFGSGIAACMDMQGNRKWAKMIGRPTEGWGDSTSPLIVGSKAIIQITDVLALDIETGNEIWKVPAKQAFGSIVHAKIDGKDLVVTAGGTIIDADSGKAIAEGLHSLAYCTPVVVEGIAYFIENGGGAYQLSLKDADTPKELWKTEPKKDRYYGSPLLHDGLIYAVTQKGVLSVIDAKDGKVISEQTLGTKGTHYTSPTLAGDFLFIGSESGEMAVLKIGREPEKVGINSLEQFRTNPVFHGSRMYLRCFEHLYCIGE